jgi:prophage regulatory protein
VLELLQRCRICLRLISKRFKRFDVSKDSIWRWKRKGDFPKPVKLGGSTTRWRLSDIERWEAELRCGFVTELAFAPNASFAR